MTYDLDSVTGSRPDPQDTHLSPDDKAVCERATVLFGREMRTSLLAKKDPALRPQSQELRAEREHLLAKHFVSEAEAAALLGRTIGTLQRWRAKGRGPAYLDLGPVRYYPEASLEAWEGGKR